MGKNVAGVIGGPPCQAFSSIGKRDQADRRRTLVGHFYRLVKEVSPDFFLMENVVGLGFDGTRLLLDTALEQVAGEYEVCGPM